MIAPLGTVRFRGAVEARELAEVAVLAVEWGDEGVRKSVATSVRSDATAAEVAEALRSLAVAIEGPLEMRGLEPMKQGAEALAPLEDALRLASDAVVLMDQRGYPNVRSAAWRLADAGACLREGLKLRKEYSVIGYDMPTGRGTLLPSFPEVSDGA